MPDRNPFLYSQAGAAAFADVSAGPNSGCGTGGFPAKVGWDPVRFPPSGARHSTRS